MFLHVGNSKNIRTRDIIGIFDLDNATTSGITRKYLSEADKQGQVGSAAEDIPKSFIVYRENGKEKILFSQLSTAALHGRMDKM